MQHEEWKVQGKDDEHYGFGLELVDIGDRRIVGHGGGFPGHSTKTLFDPKAKIAVSVLTNAVDGPALELAMGLFKLINKAADCSDGPDNAKKFRGRFYNLYGVVDIASFGNDVFMIDPDDPDPIEQVTTLSLEAPNQLRIEKTNGFWSLGETIAYDFGKDGTPESIHGPSSMTFWPFEQFKAKFLSHESIQPTKN